MQVRVDAISETHNEESNPTLSGGSISNSVAWRPSGDW